MPELVNDTTLLAAFQQGDAWAEKMVFDRFFEPLCLYSERITDDLLSSEDIVIEALTKAIDRRAEFTVFPRFRAFLYQVVHNASINQVTATKRHDAIHAKIKYQERQGPSEQEVKDTEVLRAELLQEIYAEVENLPDRCGEVFKLLFIGGLSNNEIAARLGISVNTVRVQRTRAITQIRTALLKKNRLATLLFFYAWMRVLVPERVG
jgi:RNA polymerase sigma factor (sigma-70 family)